MIVYYSHWSLINGLVIDLIADDPEYICSMMVNGLYSDGSYIYYIQATKKPALELLRAYITNYMTQCIGDHNSILEQARTAWKACK